MLTVSQLLQAGSRICSLWQALSVIRGLEGQIREGGCCLHEAGPCTLTHRRSALGRSTWALLVHSQCRPPLYPGSALLLATTMTLCMLGLWAAVCCLYCILLYCLYCSLLYRILLYCLFCILLSCLFCILLSALHSVPGGAHMLSFLVCAIVCSHVTCVCWQASRLSPTTFAL